MRIVLGIKNNNLYQKRGKIREIIKDQWRYTWKKLFIIISKMKSLSMTRSMMKNKIISRMTESYSLIGKIIIKMMSGHSHLFKMTCLTNWSNRMIHSLIFKKELTILRFRRLSNNSRLKYNTKIIKPEIILIQINFKLNLIFIIMQTVIMIRIRNKFK